MKNTITIKEREMFTETIKSAIENMTVDDLAKALAVTVYRNGVIEDYHAEGHLSDAEMKVVNKDVVNRIGQLLKWWKEENYLSVYNTLKFGLMCANGWDNPEYAVDDWIDEAENFDETLLKYRNCVKKEINKKFAPIPASRRCFVINADKMEKIIAEETGNDLDNFCATGEDGEPVIYVEDKENFINFNLYEVIKKHYGINAKGIHFFHDEYREMSEFWIEY